MQRLFFFFTLLTKHVLFMYYYVKVKFATSDLVSYLFNPCNFFLPIYSLYICIFFFFFVLYLQ